MGNCIHISEKKKPDCYLCNIELKHRYIFCVYCKKRFHYHCLGKVMPSLKICYLYNNNNLRFIDNKEPHKTEESFKVATSTNKRFTI